MRGPGVRGEPVPHLGVVPEVTDVAVLAAAPVVDVDVDRGWLAHRRHRRRGSGRLVEALLLERPNSEHTLPIVPPGTLSGDVFAASAFCSAVT
jgi:hypothetical protein